MALTHRLFGIRSCNEVITGKRGAPLPRVRHPSLHRAVRGHDLLGSRVLRAPWSDTRLFLEGRTEELADDLRATNGRGGRRRALRAGRPAARCDADGADAGGPAPEDGRARSVGARRLRPEAGPGRRGRPDLSGTRRPRGRSRGAGHRGRRGAADRRGRRGCGRHRAVLRGGQRAARSARAGGARGGRGAGGAAVGARTAAGCGSSCRSGARSAGCWIWHPATRRSAYEGRFNAETLGNYSALETLRAVLALPALPRRIDCFDISTIQGSETVASMVVCEDGRMKKGEYRKFKVRVTGYGYGWGEPRPRAQSGFCDDFAAMSQVVQRRYARVVEQGGPFPDLIVIDGGKGQLSAAYQALESLGLANLVAVGLAKKEELIFTRDRADPIVLPVDDPGAAAAAADSRRGAPLRGDVPSSAPRQARPAIGARRHRRASARVAAASCCSASAAWPACAGPRAKNSSRSSARRPPRRSCGISPGDSSWQSADEQPA